VAESLGGDVSIREAHVDHPQSLRALIKGHPVVINCAGPFGITAEPIVAAAIDTGVPYLDFTAAEQRTIQTIHHRFDVPARQAGVAVVPAMGFFGALGDMLAQLVGGALAPLDDLTIAYAINGWLPTTGSQRTQERIRGERFVYADGQSIRRTGPPRFSQFSFPAPIDSVRVMEDFPLGETIIIPRHLATRQIHALMTASTIQEILGAHVPPPETVTPQARARSSFTIVVHAVAGQRERYGFARGVDIYGITAPIAVEAALRLLKPDFSHTGVLAPSEAFEPASFLDTLQRWGFSYETSVYPDITCS
jgi:short subunit dehydrogenase-like uncharacterized protein